MRSFFTVLFCFSCVSALAEIRLWEDKKGHVLEAEFICEISGKVGLRDRGDLKVTLFMIGEDGREGEYVMLDRAESKFNFREKKTCSYLLLKG